LDATVSGDDVGLVRSGATEGCGCDLELRAWLFPGEGILRLHWDSGACDAIFHCGHAGTVFDVPAGSWTIDEYWGDLNTTVVVP